MKCLRKYKWVKLPRMHLPSGKGLMGYWAKLASRAPLRYQIPSLITIPQNQSHRQNVLMRQRPIRRRRRVKELTALLLRWNEN